MFLVKLYAPVLTKVNNPVKMEVSPELRIFLFFPANPGVQKLLLLKFCGISLINGKYIKHIKHFYCKRQCTESVMVKPTFGEFRITTVFYSP